MAPETDRRVGGRYELTRRIARGGGGTVWAAYDHLLEREVAVKHVEVAGDLPPAERDKLRARVRSEARAAARLMHPAAVAIFDVVPEDGDVYLVLELVEAPTLDQLVIRGGPLEEPRAAELGLRLLDVLVAAHDRGIVHRDVKPSNVFVTGQGAAKLADFGIAAVEGEVRLTRTGATMGSPQFIAPEQALGHRAAPEADLWGLGATLYLAVEGVPPFERSNAVATVHAVVHEPARPFERADALAEVIAQLLEKEPSSRPSPAWLRRELARIAGVAEPQARPTHPPIVPIDSAPTPEPTTPADPMPLATGDPAPPAPDDPGAEPADGALTASVAVPPATGAARHPAADTARSDGAPAAGSSPEPSSGARVDVQDQDADRRGPSSRWWVPAAVALLLIALVGAVLTNDGDTPGGTDDGDVAASDAGNTEGPADEDTSPDAAGTGDDPGDDPEGEDATDGPSPDEPSAPVEDPAPVESPAPDDGRATGGSALSEAEVPDDWQVVDGAAYDIAVPGDWTVEPGQGRLVDHQDPDSSTYLRVDWTPDPEPDPVADWEELSASLAQRLESYEELQLAETTFRGEPAALLEYTYVAGGTELRAYNLNLLAGDRAYALNLQSRAEDWDEVEPMFDPILGGFQPD